MIVLLLLLLLIAFYFYCTKNHDYWSKRNIKHDPPIPLFGNHLRNQFGVKSITELSVELYKKYPNENVIGYYRGTTPELIVKDLDIIRHILNVDFAYFHNRGLGRNPELEPLLKNLFHAEGDLWKLLRQRLTPAFTTAKLKSMFPLVVRCAEKLQSLGEKIVSEGGECDARDMMARFTTEFIGACGFGIEMDTINNEHSMFRHLGKLIFSRSWRNLIVISLWELFPEIGNLLPTEHDVEENIKEIVEKILEQRNHKPSGRNDFIDLLLELKTKGTMKGESIEKKNPDGTPVSVEINMDLSIIIAQVFVFFAAGFETSSSATSYTLHELAFYPEIQEKIQEDIDRVMSKYNNKLCYDAIAEMTLLDNAFKESLRKFPSLAVLNRVCTKRYTIPKLDVTIDPGVKIIIPIQAIQNDERYFDNPEEYRPERFASNELNNQLKYTYMPFGEGPRICIGARLGHMQSLAGLAAILHKFSVEPSTATRRQLEINHTQNVVQGVKGGIPLKLKLRNS